MRTRIWSAACGAIALATTVSVLAQDPPSSQTPQPQSASGKTITVSGCVKRVQPQGATGTSGTSEATPGSKQINFVLTNAALSSSGTAGTSGTTTPATAVASEYRLDTDEAKLSPHVDHKVEVTGTVEQPSRTEQRPPASAANAPTLKVDSVKMVSQTCQ